MAEEEFEQQDGTGFWLALERRGGPNIMIEVSERCWRKYRMLGGGSPHGEAKVITAFDLFPKDKT